MKLSAGASAALSVAGSAAYKAQASKLEATVMASLGVSIRDNVAAVQLVSFDAVKGAQFSVKVKSTADSTAVSATTLSASLNVGMKMNAGLKAMVVAGQSVKATGECRPRLMKK